MTINDISLRKKEAALHASIQENMTLNITDGESKILDTNNSLCHLLKAMTLEIKKENNVIANFSLLVQCEVELEEKEVFKDSVFTDLIKPYFYSHFLQMMGEFKLPPFSYSMFMKK